MKNVTKIVESFLLSEFDTPDEKLVQYIKTWFRKNVFDKIRYEIKDEEEFEKILLFAAMYELVVIDKDGTKRNETEEDFNDRLHTASTFGIVGKKFPKPKGLFIYGPVGTGKTTAARILSKLFDFPFIDVETIALQYMKTGGENWLASFILENENQTIVIDDIGSEREMKKFGNSSPLIDIMSSRARSYEWHGVPTIYTSNLLSSNELEKDKRGIERYGERIKSRVLGTCQGVLIGGHDHRITETSQKPIQ